MVKVSVRKRLTKKKGARRKSSEKMKSESSDGNTSTSVNQGHDEVAENALVSDTLADSAELSNNDASNEVPDNYVPQPSTSALININNQQSPLSESVLQDLLLNIKLKVEAFLPLRWLVILNRRQLHVVYYSIQRCVVIQRSLVLSESGDVELFIHNQPTKMEQFTKKVEPPLPLNADSVNVCVDRIINIVNEVRKLQLCSGFDDIKFRIAWPSCTSIGEVDKNPFQECRFVETFRSLSCLRVVSARKWRCSECSKLYFPLKRAAKALEEEERHKYTANTHLTEQQKKKKLELLQIELKNVRRKNMHMQLRMEEIIEKAGVKTDFKLSEDLSALLENCSKVTPAQSIFLQQQIRASQQKNASGMRWHPTMIRFALALHMTSPAAYELARQTGMLKLPSGSTLFEYSHAKPAEEGVDCSVLESISDRLEKHEEKHKKNFVVMADEIYISQNLVFQKSSGKLIGYTTLDTVDSEVKNLEQIIDSPQKEIEETVATKVLVYMVKGVSNGIKEVVATYTVGNLSSNQMYVWTWEVIAALESSGMPVVAFVSDGSSVNRAFIMKHKPATVTESGIIFDTWNKASMDRKLFFIADVPHLLKTIRNCLLNSRWDAKKCRRKMMLNGKKISWDFIIKLYETKKNKSLRKSFKLNAMNVYPDSYARMKVKLAAQPLSKTVCKDMQSQGWFDAVETINFIEKTNDWFDCLNGAHSFQSVKSRNANIAAYTSVDDPRFDLLDDFLKYLNDWENQTLNLNQSMNASFAPDKSQNIDDPNESEIEDGGSDPEDNTPGSKRILSKQTLQGIRITTLAFKPLVQFLLNEGTSFINARIFCQDPLEQHFSKIRAGQGGSNNPNVSQFLNRNRALHLIGQLGMKKRKGNSGEDHSTIEVTTEPLPKRRWSHVPKFT